MIKKIIRNSPNKYGKYFLSMEAPGDEEIESPIKSNTKVIDVKPNNRHRLDFTDGAEEIEEEIPEEPSEEDIGYDDVDYDTGSNQDFNQDEYTPDDQNNDSIDGTDPNVVQPTEEPQVQDDTNMVDNTTGEEDFTQDVNDTTTEPTVDGNDTEINVDDPNGPDVDTGEDFNAGADVADNTQVDGAEQPAPEEQKKGPGLEYDSTRKYYLFENYLSLTNAINNYITKLENNMGESHEENLIIKTSTEKLREIHDLCYDYMTMKFEISSYIQSLLFFQNLVIMVQLVFDLLAKTRKKLKK